MRLRERIHFVARTWRYRLRSERAGISFLLSRNLNGKTAIDIGANWGIYSYWMHRKVGPLGRVIAFEPQPELSAHLKQVRDTFRLNRLEVAEMGLSSQVGELILNRPKMHWGGASFEDIGDVKGGTELIKSRISTLDDYFRNHVARPISFIKCDVEGHELQVFQGGHDILTNDRPELLFECHEAVSGDCEVFSLLKRLDYEGFCFYENGFARVDDYVSLRPKMDTKSLVDFVFVPKA